MNSDLSRFALFDQDDGGTLLFTEWQRCLVFRAGGDLGSFFSTLEALGRRGQYVVLAADYRFGCQLEPRLREGVLEGEELLHAWVFACSESLDADATVRFLAKYLEDVDENELVAGVAELCPGLDAENYAESVEQIRRWITDGDCYQINFTFPLDFKVFGHPLALYAALRSRQPVRYGGCLFSPEKTLLSFSPELFFERQGERVVTRPMKGTAARGATAEEDAERKTALLASEKERAENVMIVDLLRNDLGRLAAPGAVRVDALCAVEAYPTLWQMVSTVSAALPEVGLSALFSALFPCGSITGAPKIRAMQRIAELENWQRGIYTGALGWVLPGGDCRFNVAIRTLEIGAPQAAGGREARLGVGSGIVIDADPAREYEECLLKARFLTGFDPGFLLIETLRLENGTYPLLQLHLERLQSSARALGFCHDPAKAESLLAEEADRRPQGLWRLRLTLTHAGEYALASTPLPPLSSRILVTHSGERLRSADYLLRHKTTARRRYDRALEGLAGTPEVFDTLFFNERDELCEGARSNVFIEREGRLLTPPLSSGLLPGVLRRSLLDTGRAEEAVLRLDDLLGARSIYLGNALRGLMRVELACEGAGAG